MAKLSGLSRDRESNQDQENNVVQKKRNNGWPESTHTGIDIQGMKEKLAESLPSLPPFLKRKGNDIDIVYNEFIKYLEGNGFYKYKTFRDYIIVRVEDNKVAEYLLHNIRDFCSRSFGDEVFNLMIKYDSSFFTKNRLGHLRNLPKINPIDTEDIGYLYFKDYACEVQANQSIKKINYTELPGYVWANQIIDRNIDIIEDQFELAKGEFDKFIWNVCNHDEDRFLSLRTAIGYLLHGYFDPANTKCIVLMDERISNTPEEANGGTGKSIIGKSIIKIKGSTGVEVSGKRMTFNSPFSFQRLNVDTQLLFINDANAKFPFEKLFNGITDGFEVEWKRQHPFVVDGIKVILSTNYALQGFGVSHERRKFEFELAPYYNEFNTPEKEFRHKLFLDWNDNEWNYFYNFMLNCLKLYLVHGLVAPQKINVLKRRFIETTSPIFYDFFENGYIKLYQEYDTHELFFNFKKFNDYDKSITKNMFTRYLTKMILSMNWEMVAKRGTGNRFKLIWFIEKTPEGRNHPIAPLNLSGITKPEDLQEA